MQSKPSVAAIKAVSVKAFGPYRFRLDIGTVVHMSDRWTYTDPNSSDI